MTHSCRICSKLACENRDKIENCKDCISYVYLELQKLNEKIREEYKEWILKK